MKSKSSRRKPLPLSIPRLPRFDADNWASIKKAFSSAPELQMQQGWLKRPQKNFLPATIRVGWRDNAMQILAEIPDKHIFSHSTANNNNMWQLGDVFEIFTRDTARKTYYELHISPNGHWMQLEIPSAEIFRKRNFIFENLKVSRKIFRFRLQITRKANSWRVYAKVPSTRICGKKPLKGRTWLTSFSRYDCTRDLKNPVYSSTSPHRIADFHRQQEWIPLRFV
jgi:hypothetical protein